MKRMPFIFTVISILLIMLTFSSHEASASGLGSWTDKPQPEETPLEQELYLAESVYREIEQRFINLEETVEYLKKEVLRHSQDIKRMKDITDTLTRENRDLAERTTEMEAIIVSLTNENTDLSARTSILENTASILQARVADLETRIVVYQAFFDHVTVDPDEINGLEGPHLIFTGMNFHIRSGSGSTDEPGSGLGNLIVGYNEDLYESPRTGSHNVVVGTGHGYSSWGGFVAGFGNTVSGPCASVSGGAENTAGGFASSVSGGQFLEAAEDFSYAPQWDAAQ